MKTSVTCRRRRSSGSVLVAVLAIMAIIAILLAVNFDAMIRLRRELSIIDTNQANRLATVSIQGSRPAQ